MHQPVQFTVSQLLLSDITTDMVIVAVSVVLQEEKENLNILFASFHVMKEPKINK